MISIIVATDHDLLIGQAGSSNGMPWHNSEDLKHFKETTTNKTIVMGKTTYMAIGRPLPNRKTIVVTKKGLNDNRVAVCDDLIGLLQTYKNSSETLYICGGANVYKQALDYADEILLSRIEGKHTGETYFPVFKDKGFVLKDIVAFETFTLERYYK